MKKIFVITLFSTCFLWNSCSNDFDVAAEWEDIPVVYGLINISDNVHYIRVEKAFLDPDADAFDIARIPDSLYYENAVVQLEKLQSGEVFTLEKVNGNLVGLPREDGIFAEEPNWLYKIDSAQILLEPGDSLRFILDRGTGAPLVTAEAVVQDKGKLRDPESGENMSFIYQLSERIQWSSAEEARIFDVTVNINYAEFPKDNPDALEEKTIEWIWGKGVRFENVANRYEIEKQGVEFYEVLKNNIPVDPNMNRFFTSIDVEVIAGGQALEKFVTVSSANSGITGAQEVPSFSNLSEGLGIFSTINYMKATNIFLSNVTRDSLLDGTITGDLNFQ